MTGTQVGEDVLKLISIIKNNRAKYGKPKIIGPDTTRPKGWWQEFFTDYIKKAGNKLDAITWHQYYLDGKIATENDFLDPNLLDQFPAQAQQVIDALKANGINKPMWLGETSSAWGGGAPDLSNRYIAGFMYLDKLGK